MRQLIAGMKVSVDGRTQGPEGMADWVPAWSEDYGLTPQIDACLLGGGMYPGYEAYWTGIRNEPGEPHWITGAPPTAAELEWSRFAEKTPHYVFSRTLTSARWPNTSFVRSLDEIAALKRQPGKDIYVVGGGRTTSSLIDAGLLDELRLIVYPLIVGPGRGLFETLVRRRGLELLGAAPLREGLLRLSYGVGVAR